MTSLNTESGFNVLDRNELIHRHLLLEASAGTGKTFAIENIVVRLLLGTESEPAMLIENILVVTFTRMATRELKERIHANLEKSLAFFKSVLTGQKTDENIPDYLLVYFEKGVSRIEQAKKNLQRALFSFDKAQIFTIHGFCWRMLKSFFVEADISLASGSMEDRSMDITQQMQVIRDFIRSELDASKYSVQQLNLLMKKANRSVYKLQKDLLAQIDRGMDIEVPPSFQSLLKDFQQEMLRLKNESAFNSASLLADFCTLAPMYNEICTIKGEIHAEKLEKAERFARLFDKTEWTADDFDMLIEDGLIFIEAFNPKLLKAKFKSSPAPRLHYPQLVEMIRAKLLQPVAEAGNINFIFARVASECRHFVNRYLENEELLGNADLLLQMKKAVEKSTFKDSVRKSYHAAIVDEFQDTDPVQWEIFSRLFAADEWKGYLHLVGDPKQSIYAFRQADIYTYLEAAKTLGENALATLDTNFRSQTSLIDGLNHFFDSANGLFSLPKLNQSLPYRIVKAGRQDISAFSRNPAMQFWGIPDDCNKKSLQEKDYLLPAIAEEILNLYENEGMHFGQFAVLIEDRYQAERVSTYLRALDIPVRSQKGIDLSTSNAVLEMKELLNGVLNYHSNSDLKKALAGRLIGMNHEELRLHEEDHVLFPVVEKVSLLKEYLNNDGFAHFYAAFMDSIWHSDGKTVMQRLLGEIEGKEFFREWDDLADLMKQEEQMKNLPPQGLLLFLETLDEMSDNEDAQIKAFSDSDEEGVAILTIHMSKGLEFDVVFALGLLNEKGARDALIPLESAGKRFLVPIKDEEDPLFIKHCEECDAEKMRQLYVALTRAREKLYIPVAMGSSGKISIGAASPIDLFVAHLQGPFSDYHELYQCITRNEKTSLVSLVEKFPQKMAFRLLAPKEVSLFGRMEKGLAALTPPKEFEHTFQPYLVQSFTSLAHTKNQATTIFKEDAMVPHDFLCFEKTEHTLPSGNETGILLHTIFEKIPFELTKGIASEEPLKSFIAPFLKDTPFAAWDKVLAKIVYQTFTTKFDAGFCLADVEAHKVFRETEFLYSCEVQDIAPGFLKGVVDLFFEHEGKYYLLDWKSNWLGPSTNYYRTQNMEAAMLANQYALQAKIYYQALMRYVKLFDKRDFGEIFGGAYYVFVRGVSANTGIIKV